MTTAVLRLTTTSPLYFVAQHKTKQHTTMTKITAISRPARKLLSSIKKAVKRFLTSKPKHPPQRQSLEPRIGGFRVATAGQLGGRSIEYVLEDEYAIFPSRPTRELARSHPSSYGLANAFSSGEGHSPLLASGRPVQMLATIEEEWEPDSCSSMTSFESLLSKEGLVLDRDTCRW